MSAIDGWLIVMVAGLIIACILLWRELGEQGHAIDILDAAYDALADGHARHLEVPHVTAASGDWHVTQPGETVEPEHDAGLARAAAAQKYWDTHRNGAAILYPADATYNPLDPRTDRHPGLTDAFGGAHSDVDDDADEARQSVLEEGE